MYLNLIGLAVIHIIIICLSNLLVQRPLEILNFHTTWGAFTYPLIFIFTDLTTRLVGARAARCVIFLAMFPGLIFSLLISNWFEFGHIWLLNRLSLRIAMASFIAYTLGQLLDILIFQKLRLKESWWLAPTASAIFGNFFDTFCFFFIAFYQSSNPYLSLHWPQIAAVDLGFKLFINLVSFIPLYGLILNWWLRQRKTLVTVNF